MIKLSNLSGVADVVEAVTIEHVMKTVQYTQSCQPPAGAHKPVAAGNAPDLQCCTYLILGVHVPHLLGVVGDELLLTEFLVLVAVQSFDEVFCQ